VLTVVHQAQEAPAIMPAQGQLTELPKEEAIRLLEGVSMGRLVFTLGGLPTVRPVNHQMNDGAIVIRTQAGSAALSCAGSIVAYEADTIDPDTHTGWSVIVTGRAELVQEPIACRDGVGELSKNGTGTNGAATYVLRINADVVNGFRMQPMS
jgi:nitroimidazol reductase NimA-like FMN-containing flavoprotein (pyridoxamine 5'-phosphate oxidase superfamily)